MNCGMYFHWKIEAVNMFCSTFTVMVQELRMYPAGTLRVYLAGEKDAGLRVWNLDRRNPSESGEGGADCFELGGGDEE